MLSICLNILEEINIVYGKMYRTIYSTVQSIIQGTQGSTVLKGDFQRKSCVPINILVDVFLHLLARQVVPVNLRNN